MLIAQVITLSETSCCLYNCEKEDLQVIGVHCLVSLERCSTELVRHRK